MFKWKEEVYEIYKEKSFSRAAQNLYVSQPSLSAKIKNLEHELGSPIFDRSTSPLRLTDVGKRYIEAAEEIMRIEKNMQNYINDLNMLKSGHLSIGASNIFAAYVLPPIITEFKKQFPYVSVRLVEGNTPLLEEMLASGTLDMVIDNNHYDSELYDKELCSREIILLVVPNNLDICKVTEKYQIGEAELKSKAYLDENFPAVPLSFFKDIPFVMLTQNNDTRIRGDRLCKSSGFRPEIVIELNQQATAYMVASTKIGATFISDTVATKLPATDTLVYYKLDGEASMRDVYFYYKKRKSKTRAMEEFIKLIHQTDTN